MEEIDDQDYVLKMKPRIQDGQMAKNKKIFPPKWFNKGDLEAAQQVLVNVELRQTQKGWRYFYVVDGETYRDGFLWKIFRSTEEQLKAFPFVFTYTVHVFFKDKYTGFGVCIFPKRCFTHLLAFTPFVAPCLRQEQRLRFRCGSQAQRVRAGGLEKCPTDLGAGQT